MPGIASMSPQSWIAHYRITAKLGEGGMGEVWRATDTKLGRDVAIKVLPESFAQDADRMARFTHEAQVLASLNHPNIAAIYGVEENAIVMELVEGAELRGPMPLDEALPLIQQLIDKPANIKDHARRVDRVPAKLQPLLCLCLMKDPRQRLSHVSGARVLLEETQANGLRHGRARSSTRARTS